MAVNGVYIVRGEANTVLALLKKARRQYQLSQQEPPEDTDPLIRNFVDLKEVLNTVVDLAGMNPITYLSPFFEVIKAQNTNGAITGAALLSVDKFICYGLIDANSIRAGNAVNSIADAVVHTKFIGGKRSDSDEGVLYKILVILKDLLLSPPGVLLSNEAVCGMMESCFKIVFEQNLSLQLRYASEDALTKITQHIFTRLPTFREDIRHPYIRYLVMNSKGEKRRQRAHEVDDSDQEDERESPSLEKSPLILARDQEHERKGSDAAASQLGYDVVTSSNEEAIKTEHDEKIDEGEVADSESDGADEDELAHKEKKRRSRSQSATVAVLSQNDPPTITDHMPYGLPCCRELLRFLIGLANPLDRGNTESMVILGLNLITVALETAADHLNEYPVLMPLIKDNLCRSLLELLDTEKLPVFSATNKVCFLLFESMRNELKFQLESYFHKLKTIIRSVKRHTSYEQKEMALESLVVLWRIPGLVTELYLNYDCDLYSSNVFEELTELLKDMSFPMSGLGNTSLLALDALLVVIDTIDENCICRQDLAVSDGSTRKSSIHSGEARELAVTPVAHENRHAPSENIPQLSEVIQRKEKKRILAEGTDTFNKDPKQGINFLREKGILSADAESVVQWLRSNPQLDKKKIAEYICSRKHAEVLAAFVKSFPFENTRLDEALRIFLESFRLPGEAAEISMVMQHFSEEWYQANNEPFNHVDAAFTLSYAIIMLNMDQHNIQVRRAQPPMTVDCFRRNLSGTNGGQDFDQDMLVAMFNAIKSEEIVMPAEQTGVVKENYLWKVLLRRGETAEGVFLHAPTGWNDHSLFNLIWGPTISTLSFVFGKTDHDIILKRALNGYRKCASIAAFFGMENVFDNLVITLCKFSTFIMKEASVDEENSGSGGLDVFFKTPEATAILFGENHKAQEALRVLFELVHKNGDILRESWMNMIQTLLALFQAHLLPQDLTEVDDFVDEKGWVSIIRNLEKDPEPLKGDSGLLSWFGLGSGGSEAERRKPTQDQLNAIKLAKEVVKDCNPSHIIRDSKYLTGSALKRLIVGLRETSKALLQQKKKKSEELEHEDILVFIHEFIVSISLVNKDRIAEFWAEIKEHILPLLSLNKYPVLVERAVVGILRIANRNLFRDNAVADDILQALSHLLELPHKAFFVFSRQISNGLHELLRNNAQDIHNKEHWQILFTLMERAGAARLADEGELAPGDRNAYSDVERPAERISSDDRGYTSDNFLDRNHRNHGGLTSDSRADSAVSVDQTKDWIHLDKKDAEKAIQDAQRALFDSKGNRASLVLRTHLGRHEPAAFLKVCDCLDFVLRESAPHITPENLESSISCLLTMVEASLDGGRYAAGPLSGDAQNSLRSNLEERKRHKHVHKTTKKEMSMDVPDQNDGPSEEQQLSASYQQVSLHLLNLCTNLHSCAYDKLAGWAQEDSTVNSSIPYVWSRVWCPLLQVMARLACDCRRKVREFALAHLQRSFLNMHHLGSEQWESCFNDVLFPLLTKLLEPFSAMDPLGQEDTRVRAIQIVAKTLLNRLRELSSLPSFSTLWLRLLDFMEKYLRIDTHGTLSEAVPETLKNMLLVLDNSGLFLTVPGLYEITTQRINPILPQLIRDTIPNPPQHPPPAQETSGLVQSQSNRSLTRVQIAPAVPETPSRSAGIASSPVNIPEIPLTEVVVHSGATSPVFPPHSPEAQSPVAEKSQPFEPVQCEQTPSGYNQSYMQSPIVSTSISSVPQHYSEHAYQHQQYYAHNPYYPTGYPYVPQTTAPLHVPYQYNQQQQPLMPQADLSKVFGEQTPQFIPPQELLQQSYGYQQHYASNPLPIPQPPVQQFLPSSNSAFQPIAPVDTTKQDQPIYERP